MIVRESCGINHSKCRVNPHPNSSSRELIVGGAGFFRVPYVDGCNEQKVPKKGLEMYIPLIL